MIDARYGTIYVHAVVGTKAESGLKHYMSICQLDLADGYASIQEA
jgi:hypothetical protein